MDKPQSLDLGDGQQARLDNAYSIEKLALDKLKRAETLLEQAELMMSDARRSKELIDARERKLSQMFVKFNKAKTLLEGRTATENERDLFMRDNKQNF